MIRFGDVGKILPSRPLTFSADEQQLIADMAARELARRAVPGTAIVPLCLAMAIFFSNFTSDFPLLCLMIILSMLAGSGVRGIVIRRILSAADGGTERWLPAFFLSCLTMAAAWGLTTALFVVMYSAGLPVILICILSAGLGAGAVANFCLWRALAVGFLLFAFLPAIFAGVIWAPSGILPAVVAMVFFVVYILIQIKHWHVQYWDSLVTAQLFENQAKRLSEINSELAETITREQEVHQEVEIGRRKMRELFDFANDGILICDFTGRVKDANLTLMNLLATTKEQILAARPCDMFTATELGAQPFAERWKEVAAGTEHDFEAVVGEELSDHCLFVQVNMRKISWQNEQVIFVTIRDISERKKAQIDLDITKKSLSKAEGYLQAIFRNIELPMYCKDLDGRYLTVNTHFERLTSLEKEKIQGKTDFEIFPDNIGRFFSFKDADVVEIGESLELEGNFTFDHKDRNILVHKFPLREDDGTIYATAGICSDVTTMKKALRTAQMANDAKAEFLANMSHELRTPMHSILSFARLGLKRVERSPREKLRSYFSMIVNSGDQLLELLNDLLDISTLEANHAVYSYRENNLCADLSRVVAEFRAMMEERNIELMYECPFEEATATYDKTKICQVLRNLLANAIKFAPDKSKVRVVLCRDNILLNNVQRPAWKTMVIDSGIGIAGEELDLVFGKFVQGTKTKTGAGGVGLGLAICKRIVEDHNGSIWASQNEGDGTTFSFVLPAAR